MRNFPFDNTLKEEVKKLNFNDLKDVDDIFENKEIKLNIDYIYDNINYLKLKQAKIRAQLIMNHFYNHETFHNCKLLKVKDLVVENVDESIDRDIEYIFAAKPMKDDLIDALYEYAFWFLVIQQAEIRSRWRNVRESIKSDIVMCCMCDSELTLNESICSVCYEPIINTIQELMTKQSLGEKRKFSSTETEDHFTRNREFRGERDLDSLGIEKENISNIPDVEIRSRHDSIDMNSLSLDCIMQSIDCVDTCLHGNRIDNDSFKGIDDEDGDQYQPQYSQRSLGHGNTNYEVLVDCPKGSNSVNTDLISGESILSFPNASRDNKYCDDSVMKPHREVPISSNNDEPRTSLIHDIVPDNHVESQVDSDSKWQCESCGLLNDQSFVSCEACSAPKVAMWTCLYCKVDNKISTTKCVGCDHEMEGAIQRRFCHKCRDNEVVAEDEICEECLMIKWVCWRTNCHEINYGSSQYCSHCGIDKAAYIRPGQSIKILKDDVINFIWICSQCDNTNNDDNQDRCSKCQSPRYRTGTLAVNVSYGVYDDSTSFQIVNGPYINKRQSTSPPRDRLYPSLSSLQQKPLWTCHRCHVDNVMSNNQCVACGRSRFCMRCKVNESINEDLCVKCIALRWRCWYTSCKNINFDTYTLYCEMCGLAQQAPNLPGEPVWQKIHDRSQLVWMCNNCEKINSNDRDVCSNYYCRNDRNTKFIWCKYCGWGTHPRLFDTILGRKCKHCDRYL